MIGIIGGTSLFGTDSGVGIDFLKKAKGKVVKTPYGGAYMLLDDNLVFIPRHGKDRNIPPHKINHRANIFALKDVGVEKIIGVNSVGSFRMELKPDIIVIPHDYINFWNIPTYYDSELRHITPGLDENLRGIIISTARNLGIDIVDKGIYIQTRGPRLETKSEVNVLKKWGDIVGMTMASEATLARELDLRYANISYVDNYCHGIIKEKLDFEKIIMKGERRDLKKLLVGVIDEIIKG